MSIVDFVKTAICSQTVQEMADELHISVKQVRYLIEKYHLDRYCKLPNTDRVWELIKNDKVQCAVCGMWMQAINAAHLSKHNLTVAEYKEKFGLNKNQSLVCKKLSYRWSQKALERGFGRDNASKGKMMFASGAIRPHSYKKSKQTIAQRIEKGLQSKAGKAKKPREYLKHIDIKTIKVLREENNMSYSAIAKEIAKKTGYTLSWNTIRRLYLGKR